MASDDGASPKELLFEACRRNNTTLLQTTLTDLSASSPNPTSTIADFLNTTTSSLGLTPLHLAAAVGSYEILDLLLDQEGLEIDGREPREGDTALHVAVRFTNGLERAEWEDGKAVVEILVDAGLDARLRNKARLTARELVDPRNAELREVLVKAEFQAGAVGAGDVVEEDEEDGGKGGPGSESD